MSDEAVVTFWFDYTCPHSHLGLLRLETLSKELAFTIDRRPYLLRPDAPMTGFLGRSHQGEAQPPARNSSARHPLIALPQEKPGLEPFSSRSLSTVLVHEATACARELGREREFYLAVAMEYWERGADLESIYTLRRLAIKAKLDWRLMWLKLESGHYRSWVMEEHRAAVDRGVKGVPSYLIGEQLYAGDVSLEELRSAIRG